MTIKQYCAYDGLFYENIPDPIGLLQITERKNKQYSKIRQKEEK